jgi:hypothetical protein
MLIEEQELDDHELFRAFTARLQGVRALARRHGFYDATSKGWCLKVSSEPNVFVG